MASISEVTFGAILLRGQNLLSFITGFIGYNPPRAEEKKVDFKAFLDVIVVANSTETTTRMAYNSSTKARSDAFHKNDLSVVKLGPLIRGVVAAQFGKSSTEFNQINTAVAKLKAGKMIKIPASGNADPKTISQSEMSYGSLTQTLASVIAILESFNGFSPSRTELQIPQLKGYLVTLAALNADVAVNFQQLKTAQATRRDLYNELADRTSRIKDYVKGTYGTMSQEYKLIKGLNFAKK